jgi:biotin synthase
MIRHDWTIQELNHLYNLPLLDLIFESAQIHRQHHNSSEIQLCHLVSIKTGGCVEDCKYCAQSSRYQTSVKAEPLMDVESVLCRAREAKKQGSTRICLGAAWREVRDSKQFDRVLEMVREIRAMDLEVCCTLGMLNPNQAKRLKEAGLHSYNHNLDTSDRYYPEVITTRTYADRLNTLANVREADLSICCGGIIGLGENIDDRLRLIQTLASFTPHPDSVPINRLVTIPGTPLEGQNAASVWDLIRTIAIARITMPRSMVRISAGREKMSHIEQSICFLAGANSIFVGEKLLTVANCDANSDEELMNLLKLTPQKAYQKELQSESIMRKSTQSDQPKDRNENFLLHALEKRKEEGGIRSLSYTQENLIDFTSNDYLGFARSRELALEIESEYNTILSEGGIRPYLGSTGSRLLTGNSPYAMAVEKKISEFHQGESALLFNSGYVANIGLLSAIAKSEDCFLIDTKVHASTWEGVKLSGAKMKLFHHNDCNHLETQLKTARREHQKLFICVESLYSMDGDLSPLAEIANLAEKYGAYLIVDEAHATGVIGNRGAGLVNELELEDKIFARIHTFGKALGVHGAAVVGSELLRQYLINFSKPFIYTTAFPLHSYVSILAAYKRLESSSTEMDRLNKLITYFRREITIAGLPIRTTNTPIQSIRVGSPDQAEELSNDLRRRGFDARAIKSPTVRRGEEMIRLCIHAFNTEEEIDLLIAALSDRVEQYSIA